MRGPSPRVSLRLRLFWRRGRGALFLMLGWFLLGTLGYRYVERLPLGEALVNALYLGKDRGWFWDLYSWWGQCVLFGIVVSIFFLQSVQQYNPQEFCRMLSREMRDHTIIVGYTHLGARIVAHLREAGRPFVLIDKDATAVDHLVRQEAPVIVDNAREPETLEAAGVRHARALIVASNNLETALLVTRRAREKNPAVRIVVRCFQDEFIDILESLGANQIISSSRSAFREVEDALGAEAPAARRVTSQAS
ncbi:MAG TPA: NAD(P)-binding protein [Polyangia bacterium]|nr:NAD(P)-binding protein [Polyangia bacterium]